MLGQGQGWQILLVFCPQSFIRHPNVLNRHLIESEQLALPLSLDVFQFPLIFPSFPSFLIYFGQSFILFQFIGPFFASLATPNRSFSSCGLLLHNLAYFVPLAIIYLVQGGVLMQHQFSCIIHRQSFIFGGVLPLTLPCSPPFLTWTWIAFIDIIDAFHLGLLHLHSYHHIPYVLQVDVQWALHIFLF